MIDRPLVKMPEQEVAERGLALAASIKEDLLHMATRRWPWADDIEVSLQEALRNGQVNSFSDLHDHMDANCLGDSEEVWAQVEDLFTDEQGEERCETACAVLNAAQDEVDRWIKAGGLRI